jgi:hypothetical protein
MTHAFTIEANKLKRVARRKINYHLHHQAPQLFDLHFRRGKLWLNGWSKPHILSSSRYATWTPDPDLHIKISYFDLSEDNPKETIVGHILEVSGQKYVYFLPALSGRYGWTSMGE